MRKLLVFATLLFLPIVISAKEYCEVVSGDGNSIGSEIACGSEHFYIVSSDEDKIKMLAKYNLDVGFKIDKIKIDKSKTYIKLACQESIYDPSGYNCSFYNVGSKFYFDGEEVDNYDTWMLKILERYSLDDIFDNTGLSSYSDNSALYYNDYGELYEENGTMYRNLVYKLYPFEFIGEDGIQNEIALGVTGEKGNANYPLYGVNHFAPRNSDFYTYIDQDGVLDKYKDGFVDIDIQYEPIRNYLNNYEYYLNDEGYEIEDIDLISVREIDNLVKNVAKKELPLTDWYNASIGKEYNLDDNSTTIQLGDLKEYLSDDYKWLWQTTYWTKTLVEPNNEYAQYSNAYFVSTAGDICFSILDCSSGVPRAGIRPLVTMNKDYIEYNVITKENEKGSIEIANSSLGGEEVEVVVKPKKGYELTNLVVSTDSGEKIKVTDGKFVMPYENVTVEASFELTYRFIEGMGQEYNVDNENKLRFRINIEYDDFVKNGTVIIDDKEVDSKYYELSEGSTIITFEKEYSDNLKTGRHEIVARLASGEEIKTDFIIKKSISKRIEEIPIIREITNPETSDKILLVIILLFGTWLLYSYIKANKTSKYRI